MRTGYAKGKLFITVIMCMVMIFLTATTANTRLFLRKRKKGNG